MRRHVGLFLIPDHPIHRCRSHRFRNLLFPVWMIQVFRLLMIQIRIFLDAPLNCLQTDLILRMVHDDIHVLILYRWNIRPHRSLPARRSSRTVLSRSMANVRVQTSGHGRNFLLNIKLIPARPVRNFLSGDPGLLIFCSRAPLLIVFSV